MARVRAKFRLNSYSTEIHRQPGRKQDGSLDWKNTTPVEKRTLNFTPVYDDGDPGSENARFWEASPSGSLQLGCVNKEAWEMFELEGEYYLDFTPAK
jgi:hypothetical protein